MWKHIFLHLPFQRKQCEVVGRAFETLVTRLSTVVSCANVLCLCRCSMTFYGGFCVLRSYHKKSHPRGGKRNLRARKRITGAARVFHQMGPSVLILQPWVDADCSGKWRRREEAQKYSLSKCDTHTFKPYVINLLTIFNIYKLYKSDMYALWSSLANYLLASWFTLSLISLCCVRKCCGKELKEVWRQRRLGCMLQGILQDFGQ